MFLIIFAIIFLIINIFLLIWADKVLSGSSQGTIMYDTYYNTSFIRTSVRGIINNIESMKMLEEKRTLLNHKNSMF